MLKILIVDKMHESLLPMLAQANFKFDYKPKITRAQIKLEIKAYDGLIIRSKTYVDKELIGITTKLKFIARAGSGIDNLDTNFLNSKSISILNAPEGNRDAVGEHTVGLILNLLHNIQQGHDQVNNAIWDREGNRGQELGNKTVGIIGYGHMGSMVAKKLTSFGCNVLAYDKYHPIFITNYAQSVSLEQIKSETDILSLHIPLTTETLAMANEDFFMGFKKNILFVNTSRGETAPFASIKKAMQSGKIAKAALDVLENEKINSLSIQQQLDFDYLKQSKRVIFTPHVAGWTTESYIRINEVLVKKIKSLF